MIHNELPEGWAETTLNEVAKINPLKPPLDSLSNRAEITFVPMPAVDADSGTILKPEIRTFASVKKGFTSFKNDDVIFAKITPCMENGKAAIARDLKNGVGFGSTEFHVLRPSCAILPAYIYRFIRQESFRKEAKSEMTGSVGQKRVPTDFLKNSYIPLPPLDEQERIVSKIEELLLHASSAKEKLARTKILLKRFRQSVLAAACSGRLTEDWREKNPNIEPAPKLLLRIGFEQTNEKKKSRTQLHDLMSLDLPELPENWMWAFLGKVSQIIMGQSPPGKSYNSNGIGMPLINGPVEFGPESFSSILKTKFTTKPTKLCKRDDLIICVRGSTTGRTNIAGFEACLGRGVAAIRAKIDQYYINYFIHSMREQIIRMGTGSTFPNIQLEVIETIKVPIPPIIEQHEIVSRVETLFNLADSIEKRVQLATARAEKLTQSILAKAFRGELVPTEAELARKEGRDYEPASVLLERIKRKRERIDKSKKRINAKTSLKKKI